MNRRVLYLGDGTLSTSARYLAGVLTYHRIPFDHVPTGRRCTGGALRRDYTLFILSDYPSKNISRAIQGEIVHKVKKGSGLLMIGGWSSFRGVDGRYRGTPIGKILPVTISKQDDRVNARGGALVYPKKRNPLLKGISFRESPVISGFNRVSPKSSSQVLLWAREIIPRYPKISLEEREYPLLIIGAYGRGTVVALTTDVAPHWVGSFVDWGRRRVKIEVSKGVEIEVGERYLQFLGRLVKSLLP